ncbi:MAG: M3 family oligoendopeptidase [Spirochaetaceae bacterium]|jgi:pepF/M3 family oligoendopeptidase|nr:M3 family oligoendopeptidase [Spirochaetaceae bacterium]
MTQTTLPSTGGCPPCWDLSPIYAGFESPDYVAALAEYGAMMDAQEALLVQTDREKGAVDFPLWLARWFDIANPMDDLEESLNAYAEARYLTATTDAACLNEVARLEGLGVRSRSQENRFARILAQHQGDLKQFFTRFPQYAPYRGMIDETIAESHHLMSAAEENLAGELERTGAAAWERLHDQIISNLTDAATGKPFNQIRAQAMNPDRSVRREAWQTELSLLKSAEIPLAAALNNIKGATVTLNKRRRWDDALDRALHTARMSRASLEALLAAIEDSLPRWRGYLRAKAQLVAGTESCAFYDLFASLQSGEAGEQVWTFEKAALYIVEEFGRFSPDMGSFARDALDKSWIDARLHRGKAGGACCIDFPRHRQSRVLCNFSGDFSDVTTLAHELGHAYHHHCLAGSVPPFLSHYPMTLAETASIFSETIVMRDLIARSEGAEKLRLTEIHLQDSCQVLVDILCRFYFERALFSARQNGELGAEDFCALMADAQEKTYGPGLSPERHPYMWAVKSHYYSPHLDFYNFPYAFGLLFAQALCNAGGADFPARYVALLRETGCLSCEELCASWGFNIQDKSFWDAQVAAFTPEIVLVQREAGHAASHCR